MRVGGINATEYALMIVVPSLGQGLEKGFGHAQESDAALAVRQQS